MHATNIRISERETSKVNEELKKVIFDEIITGNFLVLKKYSLQMKTLLQVLSDVNKNKTTLTYTKITEKEIILNFDIKKRQITKKETIDLQTSISHTDAGRLRSSIFIVLRESNQQLKTLYAIKPLVKN